jgi:DNA repair ATPase RecN
MNEIKSQIEQVIQGLNEVTNNLYQQKIHAGYENLNSTLINLTDLMNVLYPYVKENNIELNELKLNNNLLSAIQAMEQKDNTLLADILTYEIIEQLNDIKGQIKS